MSGPRPASDLSQRLAQHVETVCRTYLFNGRRAGGYWVVGDAENHPGSSLFVRLHGPDSGKGAAGKWTDAATGDHGDLLDLIARNRHLDRLRDGAMPMSLFLERADKMAQRIAGTAVFLTPRTDLTPGPMLHSLKHYRLLHERVVLVSVLVEDVPVVELAKRVEVEKLGKGFFAVKLHYGFFEFPDVPKSLELARSYGLVIDADSTTYFVGREMLVPASRPVLSPWRIALYTWLASNAYSPARFFCLPANRVVELGTQISI